MNALHENPAAEHDKPVGYAYLTEAWNLQAATFRKRCRISRFVKRRTEARKAWLFPPRAFPGPGLHQQLGFALKHEGVDLQVFAALLAKEKAILAGALVDWITQVPHGKHARRACHLFEWITGERLPVPDTPLCRHQPLANPKEEVTLASGRQLSRFRVVHNLLGHPGYCPQVRRSAKVDEWLERDLEKEVHDAGELSATSGKLLEAEIETNFAIERQTPSDAQRQRTLDLIQAAGSTSALDEATLTRMIRAFLPSRRRAWGFRKDWVFLCPSVPAPKDVARVSYLPPAAESVRPLMQAWQHWLDRALDGRMHPGLLAALASFGFVFIHPFHDGNGRLHRHLLTDAFTRATTLTANEPILVSLAVRKHQRAYTDALRSVSDPLMDAMPEHRRATVEQLLSGEPGAPPEHLYRYWDATGVIEFMADAWDDMLHPSMPKHVLLRHPFR